MTTLADLVDRLAALDDDETLYARQPWSPTSQAVCAEEGSPEAAAAVAHGLDYLLEVSLAKEVADAWPGWRGGHGPGSSDLCAAVIYYAENDAYLPLAGEAEGQPD